MRRRIRVGERLRLRPVATFEQRLHAQHGFFRSESTVAKLGSVAIELTERSLGIMRGERAMGNFESRDLAR